MIGIIGAMNGEVEQLKKEMCGMTKSVKCGMEFCRGMLGGREAVVVRSGIGKVNAAVCAQILADDFGVTAIINTGIAGSLRAEINIGDIVLSTDTVQHDMDAAGFGYPVGQIPQMDIFSFPTDDKLRMTAKECCESVNSDIRVFTGRIVSGDQFISSAEKKEWLASVFDGYCTEMEGAAIAQAAWLNQIPCLIVRAISDKADNSASMDYAEFEAEAIRHSVALMLELMTRI